MNKNILLIAAICLSIGFVSAYVIFDNDVTKHPGYTDTPTDVDGNMDDTTFTDNNQRLDNLEAEFSLVKQQLEQIQLKLNDLPENNSSENNPSNAAEFGSVATGLATVAKSRHTSNYNRRLYNVDNLIKGGIDPGFAEDIVRRKNGVELKRLELQDQATRNGYLNTQRYIEELEEINRLDVSLREELGDQLYDEYLYNSKQNNRVRISSVMLGSPAEQAGIEKGDIVLSYDNNRVFDWHELKDATAQGELGEYVSLSIYRNGEIYSFSVPRGTLGVQLGATRLAP